MFSNNCDHQYFYLLVVVVYLSGWLGGNALAFGSDDCEFEFCCLLSTLSFLSISKYVPSGSIAIASLHPVTGTIDTT